MMGCTPQPEKYSCHFCSEERHNRNDVCAIHTDVSVEKRTLISMNKENIQVFRTYEENRKDLIRVNTQREKVTDAYVEWGLAQLQSLYFAFA